MTYLLAAVAAIGWMIAWYFWRSTTQVPCTLDLESSHDHLHAHVELDGFEPEPGDGVHMQPVEEDDFTDVPLDHRATYTSWAIVTRASWLRRFTTKLTGGTEISELFEVGFEG